MASDDDNNHDTTEGFNTLPPLRDRLAADQAANETAADTSEEAQPAAPSAEELSARAMTLGRDDLMPRNKASDNHEEDAKRLKMSPEELAAAREQTPDEGGGNIKVFLAMPANPMAAPFHFSSSFRKMVILATNEARARIHAVQRAAEAAWSDPEQVHVRELQPTAEGVLAVETNT